ncbi:MAG: hypothetical protein PWQ57_862 [Desulfovibrionales bacterium]|nr:hypothetical protein [Desulfovibrionales bacterium]
MDERQWDHPRVCGGDGVISVASRRMRGPSPRVRGRRLGDGSAAARHGTIPACAGETAVVPSRAFWTGDYPRVCGGDIYQSLRIFGSAGPSPRVRGRPPSSRLARFGLGTIPACAGETVEPHIRQLVVGDHPRVCGGDPGRCSRPRETWGPSPRVRGRPDSWPLRLSRKGTIPACAGETDYAQIYLFLVKDHPRVCGGDLIRMPRVRCGTGPSPRVRGRRTWTKLWRGIAGTIPACAGETPLSDERSNGMKDHPRVCGGDYIYFFRLGVDKGPSPRVRGRRVGMLDQMRHPGTIPACAGETAAGSRPGEPRKDHPRVCGGDTVASTSLLTGRGPSPRVRGRRGRRLM